MDCFSRTVRGCLGVALAAGVVFAQDAPIRREGNYWVQLLTGSVEAPAGCKLSIGTRGPVTLRGVSSDRISYSIKKRVRARSEAEARGLLEGAVVRATARGGSVALTMSQKTPRPLVSADMELAARSDLQTAAVETSGGDIQVYDLQGSVDAQSGGGLIQMDRIGSDVSARTGGGEIRLGSVAGSIRCFTAGGTIHVERAGKESWLETAGGDILVRESGGPIHTVTAGGNIEVQRAAAMVSARTTGGRIDVLRANGIVLADNAGGSIHVGSATGVRVASAGGSIRLRGSSGALRAVTDVGSILAEFMDGASLQDSILSTGSGDITVYIPSKLPLTVRALNESGPGGQIISEFSEIMVHQAAEAARRGVLAEGALNGGGPVLRLTSTGGTIYLKRQR
jgi:DUF4097 and DUF4098 domain-containing protein YvlB